MTGVNTGWFESVAFVISRGEDKLVMLDLETLQPAGEIALPGAPETGVTTPDGRKLYVALSAADEVAVIDVQTRRVIKRIGDVGDGPWGAHMVGAINYCH
jgi:YVTN family beta-propeller protein